MYRYGGSNLINKCRFLTELGKHTRKLLGKTMGFRLVDTHAQTTLYSHAQNGLLSQEEFKQFDEGSLTDQFVRRMFQV